MQTKVKCSTCDDYKICVPIGLLSCKNCFINGTLTEYVKDNLKLIEKAVWTELNQTYNQLKSNYQDYQRRYYKDQNKIFDTLINDQTFAFTQKFVHYHQKIKSFDPRFQKIIQNQIKSIKSINQSQVKKLLIEQVKKMNCHLSNEQKINKQNVSQVIECGDFIRKIVSPLSIKVFKDRDVVLKTFTTDRINQCVRIFGGLTGDMNSKAEEFRKLEDFGKEMLLEQSSLAPAQPLYTQVQFPQEKEENQQNSILSQ